MTLAASHRAAAALGWRDARSPSPSALGEGTVAARCATRPPREASPPTPTWLPGRGEPASLTWVSELCGLVEDATAQDLPTVIE